MSKRKLYGKLKEKFGEGKYPDMPAPEDRSTRLEMGELELTEDPAAIIPPPELPSDEQLPPPSDAVSRAGRGASRVPMEAVVDVGLPRPVPQEPAAMVAKPGFNELQDEESDSSDESFPAKPSLLDVLKERFEGAVNQLGPRSDATDAGKGLSTAKPPAAMRSRFDAARLPEQEGVGIGDRPGKSLMAEEEPGIGLEMTPDRHQTLIDPPETTEQMPEQAQVPNRQLAAAVNATSAVASNSDAQNAMQRERAPENNSAYWAALKGIANASGRNAHGTAYYDAKMAEEQQAQKNWQARLAQELTSKYRTDQMKEKQREFDLRQKELKAWHDRTGAQKDRGLDIAATRANRVNINIDGVNDRMYERMAEKAGGKLPKGGEVASMNDVLAQLDAGGPQGTGYFMNKDGWQSFLRSPKGAAFRQAVLSVLNPHIKRQHGANVTDSEMERAMGQFGYGSFNSPEELESGMRRVAMEMQANINQTIAQLPPEARAKLESREGAIPKIGGGLGTPPQPAQKPADPRENFAPGQVLPDKIEPFGPEKPLSSTPDAFNLGNKLGSWLRQSFGIKESVDMAKAQEDEETRKRLRGD
jgi:hypothetical protein